MKYCLKSLLATAPFVIGTIYPHTTVAQQVQHPFEFLAPLPNAQFVPPTTSVILRPGKKITIERHELVERIHATGSISGKHSGHLVIADDGETIIFTPDEPFVASEHVVVYVGEGIQVVDGDASSSLCYGFQISDSKELVDYYTMSQAQIEEELKGVPSVQRADVQSSESKNFQHHISSTGLREFLPGDYPWYQSTQHQETGEGHLFVAPFRGFGANQVGMPYALILDNQGNPLFYRRVVGGAFDFKVQPKGTLTYFDNTQASQAYIEIDATYKKIDEWTMKNGYGTDIHGLQLLANGHALITSYDFQRVDMSQYVDGGKTDAIVIGYIVQEQDPSHNVLFEWRSWDHFKFTDATDDIDLTAGEIDYVHGNAVELDRDGNVMISS
ncbi:MAG: aryl-sulfate sulfotransferase, partial [Candidatus Kapaibacterium sp.]